MSTPERSSTNGPPRVDLSGRQLGDYRLLRRLGRGAMAEVYLAEQQSLSRRVAVKILRADLAEDPTYLERFRREARSAAALVHAGIVQIHEVAEREGYHLIAQEYVQGQNLRDWLKRKGPPSLPHALSIMRQVATALAKAAEAGIVHRDIKPENIMLTAEGEVKVADFGLARVSSGKESVELTQAGMTLGTPLYMSPEQVEGRPLDPRSDLYSFGVTCYHMLAGEPPFTGETVLSVALQHVRHDPPPLQERRPDLPPELCQVVHKMLAKDPDARYDSPRQLLVDLRRIHAAHARPDWPEAADDWDANAEAASETGDSPTLALSRAMQTQAMAAGLDQPLTRPLRRRYLLAAAGAFLVGALAAWWTTGSRALLLPPESLAAALEVPRQETVRGQWFYAATRDTVPAWQAVIDYFPDQEYYTRRARQQLARIHLLDGQYSRAMGYLDALAADSSDTAARAFGLAGQAVIFALRGEHERSAQAIDEFYPLRDELRDPRLGRLVQETLRRNGDMLGAGSDRKWQAFLDENFAEQ